jgi:hypothetical protein
VYWEEGRKEEIFSLLPKKEEEMYFEIGASSSLNKQKGHSFTCREMCWSNGVWTSNALGHGFPPVPM